MGNKLFAVQDVKKKDGGTTAQQHLDSETSKTHYKFHTHFCWKKQSAETIMEFSNFFKLLIPHTFYWF